MAAGRLSLMDGISHWSASVEWSALKPHRHTHIHKLSRSYLCICAYKCLHILHNNNKEKEASNMRVGGH